MFVFEFNIWNLKMQNQDLRGVVSSQELHFISNPGININTSVYAAFAADKVNAAKSYADITDC